MCLTRLPQHSRMPSRAAWLTPHGGSLLCGLPSQCARKAPGSVSGRACLVLCCYSILCVAPRPRAGTMRIAHTASAHDGRSRTARQQSSILCRRQHTASTLESAGTRCVRSGHRRPRAPRRCASPMQVIRFMRPSNLTLICTIPSGLRPTLVAAWDNDASDLFTGHVDGIVFWEVSSTTTVRLHMISSTICHS